MRLMNKATTTNDRPALGHYDQEKAAQARDYAALGRWSTAILHAGTIVDPVLRATVLAEIARLEPIKEVQP